MKFRDNLMKSNTDCESQLNVRVMCVLVLDLVAARFRELSIECGPFICHQNEQ